FGYQNVRTAEGVKRQVNAEQAAIVVRVHQLYAQDYGVTRIAKALNADGIQPPRGEGGWAGTALWEMLRNRHYRGELASNRTRKRDAWGVKNPEDRPAADHLVVQLPPELRIIDEALAKAVDARLAQVAQHYAHRANGKLMGRPSRADVES